MTFENKITNSKKRAHKYDLNRSIRGESNYAELEALFIEADYILTGDLEDEVELEFLFGDISEYKSICGQHISRELFEQMRSDNEDELRSRILMNIIAPKIRDRYRFEAKMLGRPENATDNFFRSLGQERYFIPDADLEYGVSETTIEHHNSRDNFKHKGQTNIITVNTRNYIYRDPPEE